MRDIYYLDHAATFYPTKFFAKDYYVSGNPNSPYALGLQANQALNEARQRIMNCLGVRSGKVIVGGTASQLVDNLMWRIRRVHRIGQHATFCSIYEHDCLHRWADVVIEEIPTDGIYQGDVVCWMMTNNITGTIFPVEQIGKTCRDAGAYYIMDAVATVGHYPISNDLESFCDCLITSAHKYGGPQGTGCMWVSDRFAKFLELSDDSHEEYGLIHGTPNVSAAVAMSYAMKHAVENATSNWVEHRTLVNKMLFDLQDEAIETRIVCDESLPKAYSINALYLPLFNSDALVRYLSSKSIYISPGHSACSNDDADASRVLEAFGLTKQQASQTVRVSFGESTSQEDINALVNGIVEFKNLFI